MKAIKSLLFIFITLISTFGQTQDCVKYLASKKYSLTTLQVKSLHEQDSIYAAKVTHMLSKLTEEEAAELLKAFKEINVSELILISEGQYIKNDSFYFADDSLELFFNGQLLAALKLQAGLIEIFPELEISVNAFYVPSKIDVEALLDYFAENRQYIMDFYSIGSKNVFRIGYFTHYFKGRVSNKSKQKVTEIELNVYPGFFKSLRALFKPIVQINENNLDMQLDAIFKKANFGQPIMWVE